MKLEELKTIAQLSQFLVAHKRLYLSSIPPRESVTSGLYDKQLNRVLSAPSNLILLAAQQVHLNLLMVFTITYIINEPRFQTCWRTNNDIIIDGLIQAGSSHRRIN